MQRTARPTRLQTPSAFLTVFTLMSVCSSTAWAGLVTETLSWQHGDVQLQGQLVYDDATAGRRPGVLVFPEWWGLNEFAQEQARRLAELGYVALAVDMYGGGRATTQRDEAAKLAGQFRDQSDLWRQRARAAYDVLARHARIDPQRIAAIGYCFGGSTALHLAASGAALTAAVSFHGNPFAFSAEDAGRTTARLLVLHGAADTLVPDATLRAFQDSLRGGKIDWQLITYGGAKHSFTNPAADQAGIEGVGYDARAAARSWEHMKLFLSEALRH